METELTELEPGSKPQELSQDEGIEAREEGVIDADDSQERWMTVGEAARVVGISIDTVYRNIRQGRVRAKRQVTLVSLGDLEDRYQYFSKYTPKKYLKGKTRLR